MDRPCCMYLNNEIEFFDGREFMANPPKLLTENKSCYIIKYISYITWLFDKKRNV